MQCLVKSSRSVGHWLQSWFIESISVWRSFVFSWCRSRAADASCWRHTRRGGGGTGERSHMFVFLFGFIALHLEDKWINMSSLLRLILWRNANTAKRDVDMWASDLSRCFLQLSDLLLVCLRIERLHSRVVLSKGIVYRSVCPSGSYLYTQVNHLRHVILCSSLPPFIKPRQPNKKKK